MRYINAAYSFVPYFLTALHAFFAEIIKHARPRRTMLSGAIAKLFSVIEPPYFSH